MRAARATASRRAGLTAAGAVAAIAPGHLNAAPTRMLPSPPTGAATWSRWLGLNASTAAIFATVLLVSAGSELWSPLLPAYLKALVSRAAAGDATILLTIGLYGALADMMEAANYYAGGALTGRLNTRRALLLFNLLPLAGLALLLGWPSPVAVFLAIPFVSIWDSVSAPATMAVVGESLPADRRTMAFSLQAIARRVARIVANAVGGALVWALGQTAGVRAGAGAAALMVLGAWGIQFRFMHTATRDAAVIIHRPRAMLASWPANLKRLLAADILARWAEGIPRPFIILFCMPLLAEHARDGAALYASLLLPVQSITNIVLYVLVGPLASRAGYAKRPYIGLTFLFFALFPVALALLGPRFGAAGLVLAFVVGGMRELGEPARKAMIAELVPSEAKAQSIGLYWAVRGAAVMVAPLVGAGLWLAGDALRPGLGPTLMFAASGAAGLVGAAYFYARFGRRGS